MKEKIVIYKGLGGLETTTESNYRARIQNANLIQDWRGFKTAADVVKYCVEYCHRKEEDFIIMAEAL
jgi:hypothetical protein